MKMILNLLIALVIAAVLFILTGYLSSGNEAKSVVTVAASVEEAWRVYTDLSTKNQWVKGYQSKELVSGTLDMPGSSYTIKLNTEGKVSEVQETLVSFVKEKNHSYDYVSEMMDGRVETVFTPQEGDSTTISSTNRYKGKTVFLRALMQVFSSKIQMTSNDQFQALKKVIEVNAKVNDLTDGRLDKSGDGIFGRSITHQDDTEIFRVTSSLTGMVAFETCIDSSGSVTHVHFVSNDSTIPLDRRAKRIIMKSLKEYRYQPSLSSANEECGILTFSLPHISSTEEVIETKLEKETIE